MKKIFILMLILFLIFLNYLNIFPKRIYYNADFNIDTYKSSLDKDNDGIDDQTDILSNAKEYVKTKPKYKSKYYDTGYPSDNYGVCTDVVAFALKDAGYDLMTLMNNDIIERQDEYGITTIDKNIDFRRVKNIKVYLDKYAISLTPNLAEIESWQAGDIVTFNKHIAIISDKRNKDGIPYIIHNANRLFYEEDVISNYKITGHYRIS